MLLALWIVLSRRSAGREAEFGFCALRKGVAVRVRGSVFRILTYREIEYGPKVDKDYPQVTSEPR